MSYGMRRKQIDWDKWAMRTVVTLSSVSVALVSAYAVYAVIEHVIHRA
jgi:hypothetical protein